WAAPTLACSCSRELRLFCRLVSWCEDRSATPELLPLRMSAAIVRSVLSSLPSLALVPLPSRLETSTLTCSEEPGPIWRVTAEVLPWKTSPVELEYGWVPVAVPAKMY